MRRSLVALVLGSLPLAWSTAALAQDAPAPAPPPAPAPAPPPAASPAPVLDATTLEQLHQRGILGDAEYQRALDDIRPSTGDAHAAGAGTLVLGKWATSIYGFVEGDVINDSTQSFSDFAGNAQVLRPTGNTAPITVTIPNAQQQPLQATQGYLGSHGQTLFSVRNSRVGIRMRAPGTETVHANAMVEMDFLGNQPGGISPASTFTNPTMRLRHAMFRLETPVVDFLVGQYWHLFGWQGSYQPNTVEIQGVPGQLYNRTPQVRISKSFRGDAVTFEAAIAASRPPASSQIPEGSGGIRLALNKWTGLHTQGATGTAIGPASLAVTGDFRYFQVPEASNILPTKSVSTQSGAVAADLYLPVIPAHEGARGNSLSIVGEVVYGAGITDLYAGMNSGVVYPFVVRPAGQDSPAWPTNLDQGNVAYDINPNSFALHPVQWTSMLAGLEYYLPGLDGKVWISGNFTHITSDNTSQFARDVNANVNENIYFFLTNAAQVRKGEDWWDVNVFYDPIPSVRVGAEFAQFLDHYVDGYTATNNRAQLSGFFLF